MDVAVTRRPDPLTNNKACCVKAGRSNTGGESSDMRGAADREEEEERRFGLPSGRGVGEAFRFFVAEADRWKSEWVEAYQSDYDDERKLRESLCLWESLL